MKWKGDEVAGEIRRFHIDQREKRKRERESEGLRGVGGDGRGRGCVWRRWARKREGG